MLWPLGDSLGTVRDILQYDDDPQVEDYAVAEHRVYSGFGEITDQTGAVDHLFAFTGRPLERETGLQNNLNRWYDAAVGRWLSETD